MRFRTTSGLDSSVDPVQMKNVTFEHVKGVEEAKNELQDVVEFLKNPQKFTALGGKLPKGQTTSSSLCWARKLDCSMHCFNFFSQAFCWLAHLELERRCLPELLQERPTCRSTTPLDRSLTKCLLEWVPAASGTFSVGF